MMEGLPDMVAHYQESDRRTGWEHNTEIVIGDLYDHQGKPLDLCGRGSLKRAVADWKTLGYDIKVGIELECFAFTHDANSEIVPYGTPGAVVYGTGAFIDPLRFTEAIWEQACKHNFKLEMMTAEYDAPQFEFTLRYDDPISAVDDVFLFRLMSREIALEYGILLTYLPKPLASAGGSGLHINLSLWDQSGNNTLGIPDGSSIEALSDVTKGCLAGLMHHHKGLAGLLAPSANSYARLQPASLSGYWQNWGVDHRGVTARLSTEGGAKARIEHRMADCTSNPYIAIASVLQAARLGYQNKYALQAAETRDCFDNMDATIGVAVDLRRAMNDLEQDTVLAEAVGTGIVANLIYMKRMEFRKTKDLEGEELRDFYIHYI